MHKVVYFSFEYFICEQHKYTKNGFIFISCGVLVNIAPVFPPGASLVYFFFLSKFLQALDTFFVFLSNLPRIDLLISVDFITDLVLKSLLAGFAIVALNSSICLGFNLASLAALTIEPSNFL